MVSAVRLSREWPPPVLTAPHGNVHQAQIGSANCRCLMVGACVCCGSVPGQCAVLAM